MRKWLFGNRQVSVQIVGAEGSGKTTFLYTFKHNEKPYEEPSAAWDYNFEKIEYPMGWEFSIYDVWPGCSRFVRRNGPYYFMSPETLVWYIHDCTDNETGKLLCPEQLDAMKQKGFKYIWCILSKQDLLPLEQRDDIVAEHRAKIEALLKEKADPEGIRWFIVADPGWNLKEGDFVRPFVKGVTQKMVEIDRQMMSKCQKVGDDATLKSPGEEELRAQIENADVKDAQDFWDIFLSANLTSWNHLDHLQAGYLVMLQSIEQNYGMLQCASTFLEHLARLREARPEIFRNTAHITMSAFWIIQLRIATFTFQYDVNHGSIPTKDDFRSVVMHTPSLMSTRLWTLFYTKEVLFAPQARTEFVMPDLQPFPQVTKPLLKSLVEGMVDVPEGEEGLGMFELPDTRYIGPDRLPRWAFGVVQNVPKNELRRGDAVKDALAKLQAHTMKIRATHPKLTDHGDVPPYSETQAYFWIQYVHNLLSGLDAKVGNDCKSFDSGTDVDNVSFEQFKEASSIDPSVWELYYSKHLWDSVGARLHFVNPDKQALANHSGLLKRMSLLFSSWFASGEGTGAGQRFSLGNN